MSQGLVVDAINDIPLLAPFFELVGIGYSAWFVYRYLRLASTRQELANKIQGLKDDVVG
uniref:CAAD domain-containing protein n=1 Tax=Desertifilum tharense IPPAS B-1220 TaxID=1781255 RepID=A0ACD5GQJ7_9CYAN